MATVIDFVKGHGTGNDFVLVAAPHGEYDLSAEQVAYLCDRNFGVGADGFIRAVPSALVEEGDAVLAEDPAAEWFMDYRNADGTKAEMCGNGIRVFAAFLEASGLARIEPGQTIAVGTRAGVKDVQKSGTGYQADLGRWHSEDGEPIVQAKGLATGRPGLPVDVGNPHVVVALASLEELEALDLTMQPVITPAPKSGANVEFVVPGDPLVHEGVGQISMRVFERGVGETLSCGTGAVASALATRHWAGEGAPNHWRVKVPGGTVGVRMFPTEEGEHISLSGPAQLVFDGRLQLAD